METFLASSNLSLEPNKYSGSVNDEGKQVATLVVSLTLTKQDNIYRCKTKSSAFDQSAEAIISASLDVFCKYRKIFVSK